MTVSSRTGLSRRRFLTTGLVAGGSIPFLSACGNGLNSGASQRIDLQADAAIDFMIQEVPGTAQLVEDAAGMLVMPLVTEAGFGIGGAYGRGVLRVNGATVDYYSAVAGSFGFQIGAQQYAHTLFFMTEEALWNFRNSPGWAVGADVRYVVNAQGGALGVDTTTLLDPVIAVVYGQAGLIVGATLEGTRYTRILP